MIRATTGGVMKTYRSNLMKSFINMNSSMNTVLSQRTFNSFAEDPAAAAQAFRLRKSRMMIESQQSICADAYGKYQQAVSCLQSIDDLLCTKDGVYGQYMKTITGTTLSMLNDPTGDAREQLSKVLDQFSQQIVQTMNQKYGDNFIFAGADGHNVPFEIRDNTLYYRGVPVDAAMPNVLTDADGNPLAVDPTTGELTPSTGADGEQYVDVTKLTKISVAEYKKNLAYSQADTTTAYQYNDDTGDYDVIPADDLDDYDGTIYYQLTNEDGSFSYITEEEYDAANDFINSTALLYSDDGNGNLASVTVDENGNLAEDGEYFVLVDADSYMAKEDYDQQKLDYEKLVYLANEKNFVDIGYGFQEDPVTGKLIESSAFNISLNGINFLGWGLDEDGDPNNIYSLIQKMREVADNASANDSWTSDYDEFHRLVGKLEDAVSKYQTEYANLYASSNKLSSQAELLTDNYDAVWEQYSGIEDVDAAEAITAFLWAQYSYNAALRVGNSVLSQSLMDYLS